MSPKNIISPEIFDEAMIRYCMADITLGRPVDFYNRPLAERN